MALLCTFPPQWGHACESMHTFRKEAILFQSTDMWHSVHSHLVKILVYLGLSIQHPKQVSRVYLGQKFIWDQVNFSPEFCLEIQSTQIYLWTFVPSNNMSPLLIPVHSENSWCVTCPSTFLQIWVSFSYPVQSAILHLHS